MNTPHQIAIKYVCPVVAALLTLGFASCEKEHVTEARFWFDRVTYDLPVGDVERIGGPIRPRQSNCRTNQLRQRTSKRPIPACGFDSPGSLRARYKAVLQGNTVCVLDSLVRRSQENELDFP